MTTTSRRRGRRTTAALAASVALVATATGVAVAAPGSPGVPSDPDVLLHETFGTGLASGELALLEDYGTQNYSADAAWLDVAAGNGLIVDGTTSDADLTAAGYTNADGQANLRALATKIGEINGSSPASSNHAVTAYTDANPGANKIEFRTVDPLDLNADGRFLTVAANVGVVNCARGAAQPALVFYLDDDGEETRVNPTALTPCADGSTDAAQATELLGGRAALFTGDDVGIVIRNEQGSGGGNDHAYDDVRVLDVTPQLDKAFVDEGEKLKVGETTDLVLTVTNTSELGEKSGWSFTDSLPKSLRVAGEATTTCAAADITAEEGDKEIVVENGSLAQGAASCDITVPVTSKKGGVFKNSAANIDSVGLNDPGATEVSFVAPAVDVEAPDTGAQPAAMWPTYLALSLGLLTVGGLATYQVATRSRR